MYLSESIYLFLFANKVINKAKGRNSKRVFQENKARRISRKTNISYPLIRTHVRTRGVRNVLFAANLTWFFSWNTCFKIRSFALLPTRSNMKQKLPVLFHFEFIAFFGTSPSLSSYGKLIFRIIRKITDD